jgi:hypothetical protein
VFNTVWLSIDPKHEKLSAVKLRAFVGELTNRSLLLGSAHEGLNMQ